MRNRTTGQFSVTLFMISQYIIVIYGKIPPSQLINLKQKTKEMHYNPQTPIDTVINQVKDLLEYGELAGYLYIHIQTKKHRIHHHQQDKKFSGFNKDLEPDEPSSTTLD